jgi:hypothetical protein
VKKEKQKMAEKQKPTKPAAKRSKRTGAAALPDWLETPHQCDYALEMSEGGMDCQPCQTIDLTRTEFVMLKVCLAKLRGLRVPVERPEGFKGSDGVLDSLWSDLEPEQIAAALEVNHA